MAGQQSVSSDSSSNHELEPNDAPAANDDHDSTPPLSVNEFESDDESSGSRSNDHESFEEEPSFVPELAKHEDNDSEWTQIY